MADKKSFFSKAIDNIKAFLGIKPKDLDLDRVRSAAAGIKTQGRVIPKEESKAARIYKQIEINEAKEMRKLYDDALKLYDQGQNLLVRIIAAKNEDFAKEINGRQKLEESYYNFIKTAKALIRESNDNNLVKTFKKLGYKTMLNDHQQEIYLPIVTDLTDIINKISLQMKELRNKKVDIANINGELPIRKLSTDPSSDRISSTQSIIISNEMSTPNIDAFKPTSAQPVQEDLHENVHDIFTYNFTDRKTLEDAVNYNLEKINALLAKTDWEEKSKDKYCIEINRKISDLHVLRDFKSIEQINDKIRDIYDFMEFHKIFKNLSPEQNDYLGKRLQIVLLAIAAKLGPEDFERNRQGILETGFLPPDKYKNHP